MTDTKNGTLSLDFLRRLAAPASSFDSFAKDPVYINLGGRLYELAGFATVSGPHSSFVELEAGREVTDADARRSDRKIIDDYPER